VGGDRHSVGNPVNNIQLLYRDLVNLIQQVYARDVDSANNGENEKIYTTKNIFIISPSGTCTPW
jgi:hypothetical protein